MTRSARRWPTRGLLAGVLTGVLTVMMLLCGCSKPSDTSPALPGAATNTHDPTGAEFDHALRTSSATDASLPAFGALVSATRAGGAQTLTVDPSEFQAR